LKKRVAKVLKKISSKAVNADFDRVDARKMMYRRYYQTLKRQYLKMTPHDQRRLMAEND
jgi:hypothetical protein